MGADIITAYLREHPTSELLTRGQRWVHLKRHIRLRATTGALQIARRADRLSERLRWTAGRHRHSSMPTQLMQRRSWLGSRRTSSCSSSTLQRHRRQLSRRRWSGSTMESSPPFFFFFFFSFFEEEALHASQIRQSQQYRRTAKGNLWDSGMHSTTHNEGSCFAMASDVCVT